MSFVQVVIREADTLQSAAGFVKRTMRIPFLSGWTLHPSFNINTTQAHLDVHIQAHICLHKAFMAIFNLVCRMSSPLSRTGQSGTTNDRNKEPRANL